MCIHHRFLAQFVLHLALNFQSRRSDSSNTNLTRALLDLRERRGGIFAARSLTVFRASICGSHSAIWGSNLAIRALAALLAKRGRWTFPVPCLLYLVRSGWGEASDWRELMDFFPLYTIWSAHGSFSSSSVLSNVARFLDLPSNQSEQPLLVYNEMFSRVLVSRRVSCEGSTLEFTSS